MTRSKNCKTAPATRSSPSTLWPNRASARQPQMAAVRANFALKLSRSLFNRPQRVNNLVGFGPRTEPLSNSLCSGRSSVGASNRWKRRNGHNDRCSKQRCDVALIVPDSQSPSLIIVEQDAFLANLLLEYLVLRDQVMDHFLLLALDPADQDEEIDVPRLQNEVHGCASVVKRWKDRSP